MRWAVKQQLARFAGGRPASGITVLTYHRVGGNSFDERDVAADQFRRQVDILTQQNVVSLDEAATDNFDSAGIVLTFDDGFADVYENAWPLLRDRGLPFTLYLATAYLGERMSWEGSTATADGPALTWPQIAEMVGSGLCTVGNHTHNHVPPSQLVTVELDMCTAVIEANLGVIPRHFAYPWGIAVPHLESELAARFATVVTGDIGRNRSGADRLRLRRVPVRRTDPLEFFRAKLTGRLGPERVYGAMVATAKRVGVGA